MSNIDNLFLVFTDIQQLETHMKSRKQRELEARDPMVGQLQQMIDSFQTSTDQLASNITTNIRAEVQHQIQIMMGKYVWLRINSGDAVTRCPLDLCVLYMGRN